MVRYWCLCCLEKGEAGRSKFRDQTDVSKLCKGLSGSGMVSSAILLSIALLFVLRGEDSPGLSSLCFLSSSASKSSSVPSRNGVSGSSSSWMNSGWVMKLWMELLDSGFSRPSYRELRNAFTTLIYATGRWGMKIKTSRYKSEW